MAEIVLFKKKYCVYAAFKVSLYYVGKSKKRLHYDTSIYDYEKESFDGLGSRVRGFRFTVGAGENGAECADLRLPG